MGKYIFEEGPRRGHAAGNTSIEQQASQLASDIRYKARQKMKGTSGSRLSPAQVQALYKSLLGSSTAPGAVKVIVMKKLFKEQVDRGIVPVAEHLESSRSDVFARIFEGADDGKFVIKVVDKETGNTSYRRADRAKIAELRANPNIRSVEITGRKEPDAAYMGDPKPNDGNLANNRKPYDKVTRGDVIAGATGNDEMGGKRKVKEDLHTEARVDDGMSEAEKRMMRTRRQGFAGAQNPPIGVPAISHHTGDVARRSFHRDRDDENKNRKDQKKQKRKAEAAVEGFIADAKEDNDGKTLDVMKGKNTIKVNPSLGEQIKAELAAISHKKIEENAQAAAAAAEKQARMADEKATTKRIKALQAQKRAMRSESYHDTKDHDKNKEQSDGTFDALRTMKPDSKDIDPREVPTRINLAKNKLRAMGLKMSYDMEGDVVEEKMGKIQEGRKDQSTLSPEQKSAARDKEKASFAGTPRPAYLRKYDQERARGVRKQPGAKERTLNTGLRRANLKYDLGMKHSADYRKRADRDERQRRAEEG